MLRCEVWQGSRPDRGFYFLRPLDGGEDIYLHISTCPTVERLEVGDLVDVDYKLSHVEGRRPVATYAERVEHVDGPTKVRCDAGPQEHLR